MDHDDLQLVRRLLARDREAFRSFFASHFPRLQRFAMTRLDGDPTAAEEVVQAALCQAVNKLDTFRGEGTLFSWLCTFCRHEISAHVGRASNVREVALVEGAPQGRAVVDLATGDDPQTALEQDEFQRRVHDTLDGLPSRYGDVLEWKYIEGMRVREIAGCLGVGEKAAESMLTRARQAFREAYEREPDDVRTKPISQGTASGVRR